MIKRPLLAVCFWMLANLTLATTEAVQPAPAHNQPGSKPLTTTNTPLAKDCSQQAEKILQDGWHSSNQWRPVTTPRDFVKTFRSPTDTIGTWVEKVIADGMIVQLAQINADRIVHIAFDDHCRVQTKTSQVTKPQDGKNLVTDKVIARTVATGKPGAFYVWSPHMQIAVLGLIEAQAAAKKAGIRLTAVLSKESQLAYAEDANKQYRLGLDPILKSHAVEFTLRNIEQHLPSMVLYRDGKILNKPYRGHEDRDVYEKIFRDYLLAKSFN